MYSEYSESCCVFVVADGLALGAAAGLSKADVELIIFLAIMLHKAPAAFGFTSFLIHEVLQHTQEYMSCLA